LVVTEDRPQPSTRQHLHLRLCTHLRLLACLRACTLHPRTHSRTRIYYSLLLTGWNPHPPPPPHKLTSTDNLLSRRLVCLWGREQTHLSWLYQPSQSMLCLTHRPVSSHSLACTGI